MTLFHHQLLAICLVGLQSLAAFSQVTLHDPFQAIFSPPAEADICVIGSGITGVSVAYHLSKLFGNNATSQEALSVVIFEARDFC